MNICEDCTTGYIIPGEPKGSFQTNGAYCHFYFEEVNPNFAIVLLTDGFGLPLVNCKIIADRLSQEVGCDVWVPDIFAGYPLMNANSIDGILPEHASVKYNALRKLRFQLLLFRRLPYLLKNKQAVLETRIRSFITQLKEERKYEKIGVVGYCIGGTMSVKMAATDLVNSAVVCHPGSIQEDEVRAIKVPTSWACAEEDFRFYPHLRKQAETIFAERQGKPDFIPYEFHDYKGTTHGFASRPDLSHPDVKEGFEKAFKQTTRWFQQTLSS